MRAFATAAIALIGFADAKRKWADKIHHFIDEAHEIAQEAKPIFHELHEDLHDLSEVVHKKAKNYKSLFNELKEKVKEDEAVYDQPSLAGNIVSSSINKNDMGCLVEETIYDNEYVEKIITAPALDYQYDYVQQAEFLKKAGKFHKDFAEYSAPSPIWTCDNREPDGTPSSAG